MQKGEIVLFLKSGLKNTKEKIKKLLVLLLKILKRVNLAMTN